MSRDADSPVSRRSVVRAVAVGGAAVVGAGGAAAAGTSATAPADLVDRTDCTCSYETKCGTTLCSNDSPEEFQRECCECDTGETACGSWEKIGCCEEIKV